MKSKKIIAKGLILGAVLSNMPIYSFSDNNETENKYYDEISNIETKEYLQTSVQKTIKENDFDAWIDGLANMPTARKALASSVVNGKIYVIGGNNGSPSNKVEAYNPITDTWETKTPMPTARHGLTTSVVDGKIYCIGGSNGSTLLNTVEVYDPKTDTWETKSNMPTSRHGLTSDVIDGKIYCIGGNSNSPSNKVEVYDPATDSWETKANMITARDSLTSDVIDGKIYCIGGWNVNQLNTIEMYDPVTDTWETKADMITNRGALTSSVVDGKIYCIGGYYNGYLNTVEAYDPNTNSWEVKPNLSTSRQQATSAVVDRTIYVIGGFGASYLSAVESFTPSKSIEQEAIDAVTKAEQVDDITDIENARDLVNKLPEGTLKDELQDRLDVISPNISLDTKNATANIDVYIKSENMLSMSLDTNSITFNEFSGVEDVEMLNAVNISINSSLPYSLNAYLPVEIQNNDKTITMDKSILNIKENSEADYQTFTNTIDKIILKDNNQAGNDLVHDIDIRLKGNIAHKKDVYKTTIKFEVEQK